MTWLGLPQAADWRGRRVVIFGLIGYRGEGEANAMNAAARAAIFNLSILPDVFLGDPLQVTAGHADNDAQCTLTQSGLWRGCACRAYCAGVTQITHSAH